MFEPNGKFDKHITSAVAKGNRMVLSILQTLRSRTKEVMLILLKALVVHKENMNVSSGGQLLKIQ